ncbi:MAG TPA: alpha/beta hydrolase [Nevskiaceae bacterium]|nr:alpha/beta hydrolase [Nevskiaceae bacterium]
MHAPTALIDPRTFDAAAIDPVTAAANDQIESLLKTVPTILQVGPAVARAARIAGRSFLGPIVHVAHAETVEIAGPGGSLPLRVIRAEKPRGIYLHLHGGGWCLGAHDQQDEYLDAFVQATGLTAVSVGYRLTPEHPYPAAHDDCEAAALWLLAHAEAKFGARVRAIGGESAGAHLAAATLLRLRDRHGLRPFEAAVLSYGGFDLRLTPSARNWGERYLILSTPILKAYVDWLAPAGVDRADPDVSPLNADLRGLPPALFTVGTLDPLLDDSLFMAARWNAAGNVGELAVCPGGVHAFNALPIPAAKAANDRIAAFVNATLDARN